MLVNDIGSRIRLLRKERNMTLKEIADVSGLSTAYISNLERNLCSPTLDNFQKICAALGVEIMSFLDGREWEEKVIRAKDRKVLFEQENKVRYESISFGKKRMEGTIIEVQPHTEYPKQWTHACDEIGYVLEGEMTINIDTKAYELHEGDSFYIDAGKSHNLSNRSGKMSRSLWIKAPIEK